MPYSTFILCFTHICPTCCQHHTCSCSAALKLSPSCNRTSFCVELFNRSTTDLFSAGQSSLARGVIQPQPCSFVLPGRYSVRKHLIDTAITGLSGTAELLCILLLLSRSFEYTVTNIYLEVDTINCPYNPIFKGATHTFTYISCLSYF